MIYNDVYANNLLRHYGYEKKNDYIRKEKEQPSEHKMSLTKNLPIELDGPYEASIFVNNNCDIIFKTIKGTVYYDTISNKEIAKFKIK